MATPSVGKNPPPPAPKPPPPKPSPAKASTPTPPPPPPPPKPASSPKPQESKASHPSQPAGAKTPPPPQKVEGKSAEASTADTTTKAPTSKTPAPTNPSASSASLESAKSSAPTPTGKSPTIDLGKLQKPTPRPGDNAPVAHRPDPLGTPVKIGHHPEMSDHDKAELNRLSGQLVGEMNNFSSVNRSKAAALTGKDFSTITAESTEGAFVPQVKTFLQNILDDGTRVAALGKDGPTYQKEIDGIKLGISDLQSKGQFTDDEMKAALDPSTRGLLHAATEEFANSAATLADAAKTYGSRLDSKANELLGAWDQSKHNQKKGEIADAITSVFGLLANVGIGGNALVQSVLKDASKTLEGVGEAWNSLGLRVGQVENLFAAVTNVDLQAWQKSSPSGAASDINGIDTSGFSHLQTLADRFHKYVDDYNNQPIQDTSWFIPSL